jgi:peptide/nickel transport system substrate-binding protein
MPWRALLAISLLVPAFSATAQEARIGYAASITTVDPHYNALTNHVAIHQHIFEALVGEDEQLRPRPELAAGWRAIDATTWEFSLRPNAHWHDGRAFTAEDVPFSISRAQSLPNSQTPLTIYTQGIRGVEIVDAATLRVTTDGPRPLLPAQLAAILLVPRHLGDATTADFNTGRNAIGTGALSLPRLATRCALRDDAQSWLRWRARAVGEGHFPLDHEHRRTCRCPARGRCGPDRPGADR